jgi:[protein-PII] uridylyltransferase
MSALPHVGPGPDPIPELDRRLAGGEPVVPCFRDSLRAFAETLRLRFEGGEDVERLVTRRAGFVDDLLRRAWRVAMPGAAPAALVAVGGYGRGELYPASDVDVMILLDDGDATAVAGAVERLVTLLWDIGLEVGHSVRTVAECRDEAERDVTVATNILESRLVAGQPGLLEAMRTATAPDQIWPGDRYFAAKWEEQKARHRKYNDSAYNLEPNIKENPGGLRDIQMIGWVAKRHFGASTMHDLVARGFLTQAEHQDLMAGQAHLGRIRFALHLLTGRREDRLLFDHQRVLARDFGYADTAGNLAVEQFMQSYYQTVIQLNRLNELLLQLFQETILLRDQLDEPQPINGRFQARSGFIEVTHENVFRRQPLALLEIFLLLQQHPELTGVKASTIRLIRTYRDSIDESLRTGLPARSLFMEILRQPRGITHELRRMHRYGILARYLPEFRAVTGRMQYDLFHVFTVDEHTLWVVRNIRRFMVPAFFHEFPLCSEIAQNIPKPELLYIAGLFHDIAKGRGGDHSELGAEDAYAFCIRHGLSEYDSRLVGWLVRRHLLMSMTAQRMDIEDPEVIQRFAGTVGDPVRLDYLYLLTVADVRATNPARWNSWKDSLLRQLYTETQHALMRGLDNPRAQDELIGEKQAEARRLLAAGQVSQEAVTRLWINLSTDYFLYSSPEEIAWQTEAVLRATCAESPMVLVRHQTARGGTAVFICAPDQDGLFALTTALLSQLALNVVAARIQTADAGRTMNTFLVLEEDGSPVSGREREREIIDTLSRGLARRRRAPSAAAADPALRDPGAVRVQPGPSQPPHGASRHGHRPTGTALPRRPGLRQDGRQDHQRQDRDGRRPGRRHLLHHRPARPADRGPRSARPHRHGARRAPGRPGAGSLSGSGGLIPCDDSHPPSAGSSASSWRRRLRRQSSRPTTRTQHPRNHRPLRRRWSHPTPTSCGTTSSRRVPSAGRRSTGCVRNRATTASAPGSSTANRWKSSRACIAGSSSGGGIRSPPSAHPRATGATPGTTAAGDRPRPRRRQAFASVNSSALPSGSRQNTALRPERLRVWGMPDTSSRKRRALRSATRNAMCRSWPPWAGRPVTGSGLGIWMRWMACTPARSHAPG